ncbi:MAG: hypothetical protein AB7F40_04280 [Victivallaceae bacterium]
MSVRNLYLKLTDGVTTRLKSDLTVQVEQWAISRGTIQTVTITLYDGDTQLLNEYIAARAWEFALGTSYDADDAILLAEVTVSGDTLVAVFSDTNTTEAIAALNNMPLVQLYAAIRGVPNGTAVADVAYWFPAKFLNTPGTADPSEAVKANYYTKAELEARLYASIEASEIAEASATAAAASETNAKTSKDNAKTSEDNAKASETAAKTSEDNAKASENAAKTSETNAKNSETAAKNSENAAGISAAASEAASENAQNYQLIRYNCAVNGLNYSAALGSYISLADSGDVLELAYNVSDCTVIALHLKSANAEVTGSITLAIKVAGETVLTPTIPVAADYGWVEIELGSAASGPLVIELASGLLDGEAAVSTLIDGVRVTCAFTPLVRGRVERQVAAKPLLYSDALGYYHLLDDDYSIEFVNSPSGVTAVALKLASANSEVTGNIAVTLTVGEISMDAVIAVGATEAFVLIALDASASGMVKIERDTASASDTLKDGESVVSAVITDINYYYVEA